MQTSRALPLLLYVLFFAVCLGLGYPILNRYDPRSTAGVLDVSRYAAMVEGNVNEAGLELTIVTHRKLVPLLAQPLFPLFEGRTGSMDPALAALLVVTSLFAAGIALLIHNISELLFGETTISLLAPALFLLSFAVPNYYLTGLVDSAEGFFLTLLVWLLLTNRWAWIPVVAVLGTVAKETFFPISVAFLAGWQISQGREGWAGKRKIWSVVFLLAGLSTIVALFATAEYETVSTPWQFAAALRADDPASPWHALLRILTSHGLIYVFLWLLPAGLWRLKRLPRPWLIAMTVATAVVISLGVFDNSGSNVDRPLFSILGGALSISTACLLTEIGRRGRVPESG